MVGRGGRSAGSYLAIVVASTLRVNLFTCPGVQLYYLSTCTNKLIHSDDSWNVKSGESLLSRASWVFLQQQKVSKIFLRIRR